MAKETITKYNVFYKPHYQNILNLLAEFHNEGGLNFEQLRIALVKGHNIDKIHGNFGRRLRILISAKRIKPGCITTKNNLNKTYLRTLLNLGIISKDNRYKKSKYRLVESIYKEWLRQENIIHLKYFNQDEILNFKIPNYPEEFSIMLYGISKNMVKSLSPEEEKIIYRSIYQIEYNIRQIEHIKIGISKEKYFNIIEKWIQIDKDVEARLFFEEHYADFFAILHNSYAYYAENKSIKMLNEIEKILSKKSLNFSPKVIEWLTLRLARDFVETGFMKDCYRLGIAFSRYISTEKKEITKRLEQITSEYEMANV